MKSIRTLSHKMLKCECGEVALYHLQSTVYSVHPFVHIRAQIELFQNEFNFIVS